MVIIGEGKDLPIIEDTIKVPQLLQDRANICPSVGTLPQLPVLKVENQLLRTEIIQKIEDRKLVYIDSFIYNVNDELTTKGRGQRVFPTPSAPCPTRLPFYHSMKNILHIVIVFNSF